MKPVFIATLSDLMDSRAADYSVAITPGGDAILWRGFRDSVAALATVLASHPGQYFGLFYEDIYEFAVALMATLHAGKRPVLLPHLKPEFLTGLANKLDGLLTGDVQVSNSIPVIAVKQPGKTDEPLPSMPGDGVLYLCTSGSTGAPTLVEKPLICLEREVAVQNETFGHYGLAAPMAGSVSHQHIYGLLFRLLWPLMRGQLIWRPMIRFPEDIATLPADSMLISSPAFLKRAAPMPGFAKDATHLSAIFSSGGLLAEDIALIMLKNIGQAPNEIFGSTETGGIAWRQVQNEGPDNRWRLFKGIEARVEDDCLLLQSPFILSDVPYLTNERACLYEDGSLELLGRVDRIVKVEEKRISLTTLEQSLAESEMVEDAAVLVLKGEGRTRLGAVVVPTIRGWEFISAHGRRALITLLSEKLAQRVEDIAHPRRWRFVKALPYNSQGKLTKNDLQAFFTDEENLRPEPQDIEIKDNAVKLTLPIAADVFYFKGHFPGEPILPGVAQLRWAAYFADRYFSVGKAFNRVEALKFRQVLKPGAIVTLVLTHDSAKNNVAFSFESTEGHHSTGRLVYERQNDL
ncbi:MAG: hypothetical protein PVF65_02140 [Sphingomonadales bacterium]|jgi:acyl-coenzyme A synthetase/AMP-(fatty) acid ligase/3-hydroxymyristoyl/3-hydroxydecanoyl-(acyl carrier protein) dehydratase